MHTIFENVMETLVGRPSASPALGYRALRPAAKPNPSWSSPETQVTTITKHLDLASLALDDDVVCVGAGVLPIPLGCAIQTLPLQLQASGDNRGLLLFWILGGDPANKDECSNPLLNMVTCALVTSNNAVQALLPKE